MSGREAPAPIHGVGIGRAAHDTARDFAPPST